MTGTEMVLEVLVYQPFNHLVQLLAQECLTEMSRSFLAGDVHCERCENFLDLPGSMLNAGSYELGQPVLRA
jgi:hypothetical protein